MCVWWLCVVISASSALDPASLFDEHLDKWESFKTSFEKSYASHEEEMTRFSIFKSNLARAEEMNAEQIVRGGEAVFGVTKFMDWTEEETRNLRGYVKKSTSGRSKPHPSYTPYDYLGVSLLDDTDVPSGSASWIGKLTTPVKDQQQCGSCWSFSASEQVESDAMRNLGVMMELSQAQLVQCDRSNKGCQDGDPESAMQHIQASGGLSLAFDYPYSSGMASGYTGICASEKIFPVVTVTDVYNFNQADNSSTSYLQGVEKAMAQYTFESGPIAIVVDASKWSLYSGGVMLAETCGTQTDHALQIVGLRTDVNPPYWIVRNSWGSEWGDEGGYIYLEYGKNTCALTSQPITCDTDIVDAERISVTMEEEGLGQ